MPYHRQALSRRHWGREEEPTARAFRRVLSLGLGAGPARLGTAHFSSSVRDASLAWHHSSSGWFDSWGEVVRKGSGRSGRARRRKRAFIHSGSRRPLAVTTLAHWLRVC